MSNDKYDHLTIIRQRTGPNQGDATERQMLDAIDDTGNWRTKIILHPDGSKTRMQTRGGMPEFITDEVPQEDETACRLKLDNGVVDLISASFLHNTAGDDEDGILYRTDYVTQHIGAFAPESLLGPTDGTIYPPGYVGEAPDDALRAKSFGAGTDASSYEKKRMITLCPPSAFTGKMRVYMQALYGKHDLAPYLKLPETATEGAPAIYFDRTKTFGDEISIADSAILFDTNCGIFTDPDTCKHYLITVRGTTTYVYRMLASKCAEKLRKHLKDATIPLGTKIRIESYILSESYPDMTAANVVPLASPDLPSSSMGYGWHFNYDGHRADMVVNGYNGPKNTSTHHRLLFAFDADANYWTLNHVVAEGPTEWKNYKHQQAITFPLWGTATLFKYGQDSAASPSGNAPFYAFYVRESFSESGTGALSLTMQSKLKVCRFSAADSTGPKGGTRFPDYINSNTFYTYGSDAFEYAVHDEHDVATWTMTCDVDAVSASSYGYIDYGNRASSPVYAGSFNYGPGIIPSDGNPKPLSTGQPGTVPTVPEYSPYFGTVNVCNSVVGLAGSDYETTYVSIPAGNRWASGVVYGSGDYESFTRTVNVYAYLFSVIPFYDAEAIYLYKAESTYTSESGTAGVFSYPFWAAEFDYDSGQSVVNTYGVCGQHTPTSLGAFTRTLPTTNIVSAELVCGVGTIDSPSTPGVNGFFSTNNTVPQMYSTYTSASGSAVVAPINEVSENASDLSDAHAFVGWA